MRFANKIIYLDNVDSTNNYAAKLIKAENVAHGTAIMAENQFNGRGQRGTSWSSEAGKDIAVSIIVAPKNVNIDDQFMLSKVVAISIVELLLNFNITSAIKWPNDIYVDSKKIAGILIENLINKQEIECAILGIGLNVNQSKSEVEKAVSMFNLTQKENDLTQVLLFLMQKIEQNLTQLELENHTYLNERYLEFLMHFQKEKSFESNNLVFKGTITGIAQNGNLQVSNSNQETLFFDLKEIKFIDFE